VAQPVELGAGQVAALLVAGHHRVTGQLVPADHGDPAAGALERAQLGVEQAGEAHVVVAGPGQHDRRDLLGPQEVDVGQLPVGVAVAVADDAEPAVLGGHSLQASGDLREVRVGHVMHDHADRDPVRAGQPLGMRVRHVMQLLDRAYHAVAQVVGDRLGAAVDHAGRGGRGHSRPPRDVGQRRHRVPLRVH
jgi:hypothetical protein